MPFPYRFWMGSHRMQLSSYYGSFFQNIITGADILKLLKIFKQGHQGIHSYEVFLLMVMFRKHPVKYGM